ncbi:hypothetical protein OPIT5_01910 [Opitutaceae bacterium TAV5]|nr:hypothetical protein OPIT5_01910 [Opitutaceae bacterium TAV5]
MPLAECKSKQKKKVPVKHTKGHEKTTGKSVVRLFVPFRVFHGLFFTLTT